MDDSITGLDVCSLSTLLDKREVSASEVTRAYLSRISEKEPEINAYITVCADRAEKKAENVDKMLSDGQSVNPLCGIPFAAKDNFAVEGIKMTCASEILRDFVPEYTAVAVERAENCGGILLGKTNMDEFAMGSSGERSICGAVTNPLKSGYSAGGSSAGSAASVAAFTAPWALGSDTGGSCRQPASFCGLVSMKPTYGIIPRYGLTELASSMDTVCPITRSVRDNAMILSMLVGRDRRDMTSVGDTHCYRCDCTDIRGKIIGIPDAEYLSVCSHGCREAFFHAVKELEALGAVIEEVKLPSASLCLDTYVVLVSAEASSDLARFDGIRYGSGKNGESSGDMIRNARSEGFGREVRTRLITGAYSVAADYGGGYYNPVRSVRADITAAYNELFSRIDIIMTPTTADCAFELGAYETHPELLYAGDRFTVAANLTGCPSLTVPSGVDGEISLPYGVSLMGRKFSEDMLYGVGEALFETGKSGGRR